MVFELGDLIPFVILMSLFGFWSLFCVWLGTWLGKRRETTSTDIGFPGDGVAEEMADALKATKDFFVGSDEKNDDDSPTINTRNI